MFHLYLPAFVSCFTDFCCMPGPQFSSCVCLTKSLRGIPDLYRLYAALLPRTDRCVASSCCSNQSSPVCICGRVSGMSLVSMPNGDKISDQSRVTGTGVHRSFG